MKTLGIGPRLPRRGTARRSWNTGNDNNCVLLLHGGGTNGTKDAWADKSTSGAQQTLNFAANVNWSNSKQYFGLNSVYFPGGSSNQITPSPIYNSCFNFLTGEFDLAVMFYPISSSGHIFGWYHSSAVQFNGLYMSGGSAGLYYDISGNGLSLSWTPTLNAWNQGRLMRDGNTLRAYMNGSQVGSVDVTGRTLNCNSGVGWCMGDSWNVTGSPWNGYINEVYMSNICRIRGGASYALPSVPYGPDAR